MCGDYDFKMEHIMNKFGFGGSQESSTNGTKAQRDGLTQQHQQQKQQQKEAERQAEQQRKAQETKLAHQRKQQEIAQKQTEKMVEAQAKERQRKRQQEQARLETVVFEERQHQLKQRRADKLALMVRIRYRVIMEKVLVALKKTLTRHWMMKSSPAKTPSCRISGPIFP